MKIYVSICKPPRGWYFAPAKDTEQDISIEVPDKSQKSFEYAHEKAIEWFCEKHKCKPGQVRIIGAF